MIRILVAALLVTAAQDEPKDNSEKMKELSWMVGTWVGEGEMPGLGKYTETMSFAYTMKGNFLKVNQKVVVDGKEFFTSHGMLGWDKRNKRWLWSQFGIDGTIGWGHADEKQEKNTVVFNGETSNPPPFDNYRSTYKKTGDDTMEGLTETKKEEGYEKLFATKYKRKKEEKEK